MMMIDAISEGINKALKEIQESTGKMEEVFKEERQKFHKELQENTIKQAKKMNKTIQDLKMEIQTIKKQTKGDNPGDRKPRKEP